MKKKVPDYPFEIRTLSREEGGGFLISYPDFDGCIGDGETVEDAMADGRKALAAVIDVYREKGWPIPEPGSYASYSGKFVQRVPKSMHAQLRKRARIEGVSLNDLVTTYIAGGLAGSHNICSEEKQRYRESRKKTSAGR